MEHFVVIFKEHSTIRYVKIIVDMLVVKDLIDLNLFFFLIRCIKRKDIA